MASIIEKVNVIANPLLTDLDKAILKSTKRSVKPLKMKHIQLIVSATFQREYAIYDLFRLLEERLREQHWVVAFKSLVVIHILMRDGNGERVLGFLATQPSLLNMSGFRDRSDTALGHEQTKNIRAYALYLEEKVAVYRELRKEVLKDKDLFVARLRSLPVEDGLLKEVGTIQRQVQALLGCKFHFDEIDNVVTMQSFRLLVSDLLGLYHLVNEGVIRILELFFDMSKKHATEALVVYKQFAQQTAKVVEFFDTAKRLQRVLGAEIPVLKHAPVSLVQALEEYVNQPNFEENRKSVQAKKKGSIPSSSLAQTATQAAAASASQPLPPPPQQQASSTQLMQASAQPQQPAKQLDFFSSLEEEFLKPSPTSAPAPTQPQQSQPQLNGLEGLNPFFSQPSQPTFGAPALAPAPTMGMGMGMGMNMGMNNNMNMMGARSPPTQPMGYGTLNANPFGQPAPFQQPQQQANPFGLRAQVPVNNGFGAPLQQQQQQPQAFSSFTTQSSTTSVFAPAQPQAFGAAPAPANNPFAPRQQPQQPMMAMNMNPYGTVRQNSGNMMMGGFQQPQQQQQLQQQQPVGMMANPFGNNNNAAFGFNQQPQQNNANSNSLL